MATATPTLKFTIEQYDLMIEAGVFARPPVPREPLQEPPRVELIEGEIVMMSPIGSRHEEIVDRLAAWSFRCLPEDVARARIQQSLGIPGRQSVPQPDVAWVQPRDYAARRPEAADALLVIEVAETSLSYDLGEKAAIYAAGGVPDYWVVDAAAEIVHILRMPGPLAYAERRVAGRGELIAPRVRPDAVLAVESLFGRRP
jgi:Uma2 family endonuclease